MAHDVAQIAAGLSPAQQSLLCEPKPRAVEWYPPRVKLEALGLLLNNRHTELGLAVREHLLSLKGGK